MNIDTIKDKANLRTMSQYVSRKDLYDDMQQDIKLLVAELERLQKMIKFTPDVIADAENRAIKETAEHCAQICAEKQVEGPDGWTITRSKAFYDAEVAICQKFRLEH